MKQIRKKRVLLISIIPKNISDEEALIDLNELKALVDSYGAEVVDLVIQRREVHDKGGYIGSGKMNEVLDVILKKKIDIVVLNAQVKPGQIYDIKSVCAKINSLIEVWDRIDLILQIFSKHAHTTEARLQIELAAMRHMGPRIYGMGMELSRQTGGIGTRGVGETNTELMKRHWREQVKQVRDKLNKLTNDRMRQLDRRKRLGLATVSLVGYTNAGKTSLFNYLTGKKKLVQNALFVTLDSAVGKIKLTQTNQNVLVSDTIGFIRNLPAELIDAFKSTLIESVNADILLHVIDVSDKQIDVKIKIVENILRDLGLQNKQIIYIFNKVDLLNKNDIKKLSIKYPSSNSCFLSVKTGEGVEKLFKQIESYLVTNQRITNT